MTSKEELERIRKLERLVGCIRAHCPKCAANHSDGIDSFANHILVCHENSRNTVGNSEDVERLEELERHIRKASSLLIELSDTTKRKLNYSTPLLENEQRPKFGVLDLGESPTANNRVFDKRAEALQSLQTGLGILRADPNFKIKASNKRNYEAAVVAAACRKVWRVEFDGKEPPKVIRQDRNHPMGSFIEETFDILTIGTSASTALSSLKKLGGESAIFERDGSLSVEVG